MRGRKPVPTPLRVVRGNPGKRPLPQNEPVPPAGEMLCPAWVQGRAKDIWHELRPVLEGMRVLTLADAAMFAVLCETQAEFIEARLDVRERGTEVEQRRFDKHGNEFTVLEQNPSVKIASDAGKRVKALMVEFGLSPSSRTRVTATPKPEADDPFARFENHA